MMIQLPVYRTGEGLQSVSSQILRILTDFFHVKWMRMITQCIYALFP